MSSLGFFDQPGRAVITVTACSLVVAVVCFGALESTGMTHTAGGSFGGAFAAFLAASGVLSTLYLRTPSPASAIPPRERRRADFVFEEIVKIVDFRNAATGDRQRVVVTDYRVLTKESDKERYVFEYGTNGQELTGVCLSHPTSAHWQDVTTEPLRAGEARHTEQSYELTLDLDGLATGESTRVINELTFVDAFVDDPEWFHTHLEEPTGRLTFVFLFPEDHLPHDIRAETKGSGRTQQWNSPPEQPVRMRNGSLLYWRVHAPDAEQYRLEWRWEAPVPPAFTARASATRVSDGIV